MSAARPEPADELLALTGALGATLGRRRRRGKRRLPRPAGLALEPLPSPPSTLPAPGDAGAQMLAVKGVKGKKQAGARPGFPPPPPTRRSRSGGGPPPVELPEAAEIRARAAECGDLESLREAVAQCRACGLCETRTQTVFADGDGSAGVMFVGEAPGADEDAQGVPFVGRAGELLTDIITKGMGLARERVLIANVLKCRPPGNRDPLPAEKALCTPWLDRQIELVRPRVLIPLGAHAAQHLLQTEQAIGRLRGRVGRRGEVQVVPTYHPAFLLRSPGMKGDCWKDIQVAMGILGLPQPGKPSS